jgi:hypothetical protein
VQDAGVAGEPCRDDAADATTETAQPRGDPSAGTHIGHRRQALEAHPDILAELPYGVDAVSRVTQPGDTGLARVATARLTTTSKKEHIE